jgi:drug/metabolite transporter (DMT)-like permease
MAAGAALGSEPLTARKAAGVTIAVTGVSLALVTGLKAAPASAWRGDILMIAAALCMAFYSIWSRPLIRRSGPLTFTVVSMGAGAACLIFVSICHGSFEPAASFGEPQWFAAVYLGAFGSALTFFLWSLALERTTPTRVAISVTVNPISASLTGALFLGEPLRWNLVLGFLTVFLGIWVATTQGRSQNVRHLVPEILSKEP